MGDSDITVQLSFLTYLLIVTAFVTFVVALCVHKRFVRILIGIFLFAMAATCVLFSMMAVLLVAALGVVTMVLAIKTPVGITCKRARSKSK